MSFLGQGILKLASMTSLRRGSIVALKTGAFLSPLALMAFSTSASAENKTPTTTLKLSTQACMLPHPSKAHKGGEDASFISDDGNGLGVADGVGGWSEIGVDPALYARALMKFAKEGYDKSSLRDPKEILQYAAHKASRIQGSSTACILVFNPKNGMISAANLGDRCG
jgi:protein phosphatase PTC7